MPDEHLQEILTSIEARQAAAEHALEARQAVFERALSAVIADLDAIYEAVGEDTEEEATEGE
jgi:hypothetical protein